jgi:hypothetical protein
MSVKSLGASSMGFPIALRPSTILLDEPEGPVLAGHGASRTFVQAGAAVATTGSGKTFAKADRQRECPTAFMSSLAIASAVFPETCVLLTRIVSPFTMKACACSSNMKPQ